MATRIAPSADISEAAVIGDGSAVWHLAQVREHAVLGEGCVVGRGAYIGEGVRMGRQNALYLRLSGRIPCFSRVALQRHGIWPRNRV